MGRYILLEFDDNDSAVNFADEVTRNGATARSWCEDVRVVGQFTRASMLCECRPQVENSYRGTRFGWWVCRTCRKPKEWVGQILYDMNSTARAKDKMVWIGVRWKYENGRVVTVTDA